MVARKITEGDVKEVASGRSEGRSLLKGLARGDRRWVTGGGGLSMVS
jgi:hypothetical protein